MTETIFIPLSAHYLLTQRRSFLQKYRNLHLVLDLTHDLCLQQFKLGGICLLGFHKDEVVVRTTAFTLRFFITNTESTVTCPLALQCPTDHFHDLFRIDLKANVSANNSDGSTACKAANKSCMPGVYHHLCLEHIKKNAAREVR